MILFFARDFSSAASAVVGATSVACGRGANLPCAKPKDCPGCTTRSLTDPTPDTREDLSRVRVAADAGRDHLAVFGPQPHA
jgi:hypothetical protein